MRYPVVIENAIGEADPLGRAFFYRTWVAAGGSPQLLGADGAFQEP